MLDHSGVLSPMNLKRYMFCVFRTSRLLSLSLSLQPIRPVLRVLHVRRVVPHTVPGDVDPVLCVICVLQGEKKPKKEQKEKKKHMTEHKSKAKPEGRKEEKKEDWKEEAKPKKKKREERKEEEKKDPKGKSRRIVANDDAPEEVLKIKAEPARMVALLRRALGSTHLEVKDEPLSPCGSASSSSSKSGSNKSSTSSSNGSSSSSSESNESAEKSPVDDKGAL